MEYLEHFNNSRKYGGSVFSFFEYEQVKTDEDDDFEEEDNNEEE